MTNRIVCLLGLLFASACGPARNITYFSNSHDTAETTTEIANKIDPIIQPDDLLSISVSSLNAEANVLFNSGVIQSVGGVGVAGSAVGKSGEGYLVNEKGAINFPVLGSVSLGGLTKEQATAKMTAGIQNHVKNPIVNIRFLNFKITVIGEVGRPSTLIVPTERINLVEALAQAGDITALGKRDNVLIIREKNGVRSTMRANLNDKAVLNSPYYYLQQNDIVYVEPIKMKKLQGNPSSFYLQLLGAGISLASILVIFLR
ncbi:polysaccharide biosynthesis/export family protein [Hymenobacter arizonensis]|uniref:Polysaccharide export outer membrane protein n=1 Tax=Hymenobacter arizonensis TaxID=1227077 RepID=A0A1I6BRR5_HYMAR|nr:polysaccharide biosynthesis/export family protein [Hymenobacter arizonensis]SFQ83574.1 polysaccharide export outer membrane protein [Hymenobacter arizonensis]